MKTWSVTVEAGGQPIITLESDGEQRSVELTDADMLLIQLAGISLLGFVNRSLRGVEELSRDDLERAREVLEGPDE